MIMHSGNFNFKLLCTEGTIGKQENFEKKLMVNYHVHMLYSFIIALREESVVTFDRICEQEIDLTYVVNSCCGSNYKSRWLITV